MKINQNNCNNGMCPVEKTLSILGKKYTLLIIRDLLVGTKRFGELQRSIKEISTKTLSERLDELENAKLIKRKAYKTIPVKVEYSLTDTGKTLKPIIEQMRVWGNTLE